MSDHMVRRAGVAALLMVLLVTLVRFGRRLVNSRNDKIGITPIPIP